MMDDYTKQLEVQVETLDEQLHSLTEDWNERDSNYNDVMKIYSLHAAHVSNWLNRWYRYKNKKIRRETVQWIIAVLFTYTSTNGMNITQNAKRHFINCLLDARVCVLRGDGDNGRGKRVSGIEIAKLVYDETKQKDLRDKLYDLLFCYEELKESGELQ